MLVGPWDFPFWAGRGSRVRDLGQRLWIFGAGRREARRYSVEFGLRRS